MNSLKEIESAIDQLDSSQLAELYAWLNQHRPMPSRRLDNTIVFEKGLGLLGSAEDAALLDEVVQLAYEERRRPSSSAL